MIFGEESGLSHFKKHITKYSIYNFYIYYILFAFFCATALFYVVKRIQMKTGEMNGFVP